jgi:hypothetical protein
MEQKQRPHKTNPTEINPRHFVRSFHGHQLVFRLFDQRNQNQEKGRRRKKASLPIHQILVCVLKLLLFKLPNSFVSLSIFLNYKYNIQRPIMMSAATTGSVLLAPSPAGQQYDLMYYLKGAAAGGICCSITHGALTPVDVVKTRVQLDPVKVSSI